MTKEQLQSLAPGCWIQRGTSSRAEDCRWGKPEKVVSIFARGTGAGGRAYVLGYTQWSENAEMSFSADENTSWVRLVEAP